MDLDNLLKYQAIDVELKKLQREMNSNENCKIADEAKRRFNEMRTVVAKSENVAAKVYGGYAESVRHYDETIKKAEELMGKLEDDSLSEEETEKIAENLVAINKKLGEIADFIENIRKKGENAVRDFTVAQKSGHKLKDEYGKARDELKKLEEQYKPKIDDLQQKLTDARGKVDKKLLETYDRVSKEVGLPAFVEVYDPGSGDMNCAYCGISLSLNTKSELKDNGYCLCEKCHRIIYSKKS